MSERFSVLYLLDMLCCVKKTISQCTMASPLLLSPLFLHLIFFLQRPVPSSAQSNSNITVGDSLIANGNSSLLSPSGDFAFGFSQLQTPDIFLLSIWYAQIPNKTIVWYPQGGAPAARGSKVQLTSSGLVLTGPQGDEIWRSSSISGMAFQAAMSDTGNFVISDRKFNKLWDSFSNPSDTILPTQTMERGGLLSSRLSETNFSTGKYQLLFQLDGNVVLHTINLPSNYANKPYYASGTNGDPSANMSAGLRLFFNESGYMYILKENGQISNMTGVSNLSSRDFYFRVTLDFYGVLTRYYHPKASSGIDGGWTVASSIPDDICYWQLVEEGTGICGYNSICSLGDNNRPVCQCPSGFSLLDPNDSYGTCKPDFHQTCEQKDMNPDLYTINVIRNIDFWGSNYVRLQPSTEQLCRSSCLQDCMCDVAIFTPDNSCLKKRLPLSNGRVDTALKYTVFMKIRRVNSTTPDGRIPQGPYRKPDKTTIVAMSAALGGTVFVSIILVAVVCLGLFHVNGSRRNGAIYEMADVVKTNVRCFTYQELSEATNGFTEELGRGAFGIVYKGEIQQNFTLPVAVKKISSAMQESEKEFRTEVNVIGQTHHKNLVRLIGFCDEGPNKSLVYEFLSNGTLASFLFGRSKPSWKIRTQIALGIARGLLYLHEECSTQIIHCDIKPQNILLDDHYEARISDFGLAKLLMLNQSHTHTAIRGTRGYVAPEWFRNMPITAKVDVYSFGVVLLEIICCRKSLDMEAGEEERVILTDWAYDCYLEGSFDDLVEDDWEAMDDKKKMERFVKTALWCIQEDPAARPTMRNAFLMLEEVADVASPPFLNPVSFTAELASLKGDVV